MTKRMVRTQLSGLLVALLVGSATLIVAAGIPADDGRINGCYSRATGDLRVVETSDDCRRNETAIYWNQTGPTGPEGAAGPTGPQGPAGGAEVFSTDQALGEMGPIQLGPQSQVIARFAMPPGRYAIAATAQLLNDSSYGINVSCGVFAGNRRFEAADTVWGGSYTSQAISGASNLADAGYVTLSCRADAGDAVRVVAFSLTTTTLGSGGTTTTGGNTGYTAGGTTTASSTSTTGGTGSSTGTATTSTTSGTTGTTGGTSAGTTSGTTTSTTGTTGTTGSPTGSTSGTTTGTTGYP